MTQTNTEIAGSARFFSSLLKIKNARGHATLFNFPRHSYPRRCRHALALSSLKFRFPLQGRALAGQLRKESSRQKDSALKLVELICAWLICGWKFDADWGAWGFVHRSKWPDCRSMSRKW